MKDTVPWTIRNYQPGDEARWLALIRAAPDLPYVIFNHSPSLDTLRMTLQHPHMDPAHNLFFAGVRDQLVAFAELWHAPGRPRTTARILVHPGWRRQGLGTHLVETIAARARELDGQYLDVQIESSQSEGRAFLQAHGFQPVHFSWQMALSNVVTVPEPVWPDGYGRRTFVTGQDELTSACIENESFGDEWEFTPVELGEIEGFVRSPSFRAGGVIYATCDGEAVGECWSSIDEEAIARTGAKQGDVGCLCVHPAHRGRGLGRALLLAGVGWLRRQGTTSVTLYVDGANDRARHLYESAGFVAARTEIWYREAL